MSTRHRDYMRKCRADPVYRARENMRGRERRREWIATASPEQKEAWRKRHADYYREYMREYRKRKREHKIGEAHE